MKKTILTVLSVLVLSSFVLSDANAATNSDLSNAIRLYKAHNYTECYLKLQNYIKKDPSSALAYYYLAMVYSQVGNTPEAIDNYEKAIALAPEDSNLMRYAKKGKACLEDEKECKELKLTSEDDFIKRTFRDGWSDSVRGDYERLKLENMMREINRSDEVSPQQFRDFKDFSSMNNGPAPTNDEVVAAFRVLQRAGFINNMNTPYSDISLLTGETTPQRDLLNMMGTSSLNPQIIQAMLTSNMSLGF